MIITTITQHNPAHLDAREDLGLATGCADAQRKGNAPQQTLVDVRQARALCEICRVVHIAAFATRRPDL
jgi:hypothetical protein